MKGGRLFGWIFQQKANQHQHSLRCSAMVGCGGSGVIAWDNATITLSGQGTSIQGNGTKRNYGYGLNTYFSSSTIHIVHPLTLEQISTDNCDGGGTIKQVANDGVVLQVLFDGDSESD